MTETMTGIAISEILSGAVNEDGAVMMLTYKKFDGTTENLALPIAEVPALLTLTMQCLGRSQEKEGQGLRRAIPAKSWEIHIDDEDRMIFTLGLDGGAWLAFVLPLESRQQVKNMSDLLARRAVADDDKTRH